jgi:hypothetical protein
MLMAGGIATFGLWMRCHFVEARSKAKNLYISPYALNVSNLPFNE